MLVLGIESSCDETGVALVQWRDQAMPTLLSDGAETMNCTVNFAL